MAFVGCGASSVLSPYGPRITHYDVVRGAWSVIVYHKSIFRGVFTNLWYATKDENRVQSLLWFIGKPRFAQVYFRGVSR
jgi:hypothetical protein